MHPSTWLLIKGPRPKDQQVLAEPVPPDKFAATHTCWGKGKQSGLSGRIGTAVDNVASRTRRATGP
eukprot:1596013-Prorocentrum_lima.AAC.1